MAKTGPEATKTLTAWNETKTLYDWRQDRRTNQNLTRHALLIRHTSFTEDPDSRYKTAEDVLTLPVMSKSEASIYGHKKKRAKKKPPPVEPEPIDNVVYRARMKSFILRYLQILERP